MIVDWPIGTPEERAAARGQRLPSGWTNNNPFANYYEIAPGVWNYHDGVDLNLNTPTWNADWHRPVYAMADGVVYYAGAGGGSWGQIVCIAHVDPLTSKAYFSRYGHIEAPQVSAGEWVRIGQRIASVGNGDGYYGQSGAHLHWNICATNLMYHNPAQWCGTSRACVLGNYVDPIQFVKERAMVENPDTAAAMRAALAALPQGTPITITPALPPEREPFGTQLSYVVPVEDVLAAATPPNPRPTLTKYITANPDVNVRPAPNTTQAPVGKLLHGAAVTVYTDQVDSAWWQIAAGQYAGKYVSAQWVSDERPQ